MRVGILHPGSMGSALAANTAADVFWVSDGRSDATLRRATWAGLDDAGSLGSVVERVDVIISVCPPHAAEVVATAVSSLGFEGLYVDANAVAPSTALRIANLFGRFVDGGIVGGPPSPPRDSVAAKTRFYLSGREADTIAGLFDGSNVGARVIGESPGRASALKVAYAGWTKGTTALLLTMAAYARSQEVLDDLIHEWQESIPELPARLESLASRIGRKAWRFEGEMEEIALSLDEARLPDGFHMAAAEAYARLAGLKDVAGIETVAEILALVERGDGQ